MFGTFFWWGNAEHIRQPSRQKNGIVGRVAAAAAGDSTEYEGVTANAVRLFKYLVPDYYEDFKKSVATWVHDYLKVLLPSGAGELPQDRAQAGSLQVLYTKHVMTLRRVTRVVWRRPMCQQSMRPRANGQPQAAAGQPPLAVSDQVTSARSTNNCRSR